MKRFFLSNTAASGSRFLVIFLVMLMSSALILTGCSGDDGEDDTNATNNDETDTGGDADAIDDEDADAIDDEDADGEMSTLEEFAERVCAREQECCTAHKDTVEECEESVLNVWSNHVELENIDVDEAAMLGCAETVEATSCDEMAAYGGFTLLICDEGFTTGTQENGGACGSDDFSENLFRDDECQSGYCFEGECAEPAEDEGAECEFDGCADGLYCYQGSCRVENTDGEDCSEFGICADGHTCITDGGDSTCQPKTPIELGEACEQGTSCEYPCACAADNLGCGTGVCGRESHCR